ncbi:MAG: ion transport 2 domain protein [Lysobacteraceae bacterium]|nr:MAG: ion transport 2 domain protein [Xanthomonadaceae bacterium]
MYGDWLANVAVVLATVGAVVACVLLHYEGLVWMSRSLLRRHEANPRRKVLLGVLGVLMLHVAELWLFGATFWGLGRVAGTGHVVGADPLGLLDAVYMATMSYTTVGFGDVVPVGAIRLLAGTCALTGFVMITWSASFLFLEMERFWRR